ncbi:MAG: hypothetical protein ACREKH_07205 [Candidatus Rokuibacteriota bacterium]
MSLVPRHSSRAARWGIAAALLLAVAPLAGQDRTLIMGGGSRELGGHRFLPSAVAPDPFLSTRVGASLGFGAARDLAVPIRNLDDSLLKTVTGDLGFLGLELEYQQRVAGWLVVRAGLGGSGRLGVDKFSFAAEGLSTVYGFNLGTSAGILKSERFQLTAALDYSSNSLFGTQPLTYLSNVGGEIERVLDSIAGSGTPVDSAVVDSVLDAIDLSQFSVVESGSSARASVGVRMAYAAAPWIGFTATLQTGFGDLIGRSSTEHGIIDVAGSASIDFRLLWNVPVGIALAGRYQNFNARAGSEVAGLTSFSAFIGYTGRRDLALGVELSTAQLGQPSTDKTISVGRAALSMTYYFY